MTGGEDAHMSVLHLQLVWEPTFRHSSHPCSSLRHTKEPDFRKNIVARMQIAELNIFRGAHDVGP